MNGIVIGSVVFVLTLLAGAFLLRFAEAWLHVWTLLYTLPLGKPIQRERLDALEDFVNDDKETLRGEGYRPAEIALTLLESYFVRPLPGHVWECLRGSWALLIRIIRVAPSENMSRTGTDSATLSENAKVTIGTIGLRVVPQSVAVQVSATGRGSATAAAELYQTLTIGGESVSVQLVGEAQRTGKGVEALPGLLARVLECGHGTRPSNFRFDGTFLHNDRGS